MPEDFLYYWKASNVFTSAFIWGSLNPYVVSMLDDRDAFACYCMMSI